MTATATSLPCQNRFDYLGYLYLNRPPLYYRSQVLEKMVKLKRMLVRRRWYDGVEECWKNHGDDDDDDDDDDDPPDVAPAASLQSSICSPPDAGNILEKEDYSLNNYNI
ncbi:hypothetical protein SUGI_0789110 [Cryptomeria japonica]|nr:hypothetical protein SUGI_0789110 [Cryptomeria japonica]